MCLVNVFVLYYSDNSFLLRESEIICLFILYLRKAHKFKYTKCQKGKVYFFILLWWDSSFVLSGSGLLIVRLFGVYLCWDPH